MKLNLKKMVGTAILCGFGSYGMAWAADAEAGKTVYGAKCKICHAADGQGRKRDHLNDGRSNSDARVGTAEPVMRRGAASV